MRDNLADAPTMIWRSGVFCPFVTPDGRYFFFSRRHTVDGEVKAGDVYWIDAKYLDQFRR